MVKLGAYKEKLIMPKQKKLKTDKRLPILYALVLILAIVCAALTFAVAHKAQDKKSPSISLGSMQYQFANGRATERDDRSVNGVKTFLETDAVHEGCPDQTPAYEHVVAYTKDETQLFIKYGCGAADSPIYAVKVHDAWKMLSPTNHFDVFGIPDCDYVAGKGISKEVAPVCAEDIQTDTSPQAPQYTVR